jgi:hypothetical protein
MLTRQDEENYGPELLDMTRRAALDALGPEVRQLQQENQHLRAMAQQAQHAAIEQALDRSVPDWRAIYQNPAFSQWLSQPDYYSDEIRSQLMRRAVADGDSARVCAFYRGFQQADRAPHAPAGQYGHARSQQRQPVTGGKPVYTREQIKRLYDERRHGRISDARWGPIEADIFAAARENRVAGTFNINGDIVDVRPR